MITYDIGIAQCDNRTVKYEKKIREPLNVIKVQSHMLLVLSNVTIKLSNVRKKYKGTIECDKSTIIYDVGTA